MRNTLVRWATVLGAIPRIVSYREHLANVSYYERLRFCNSILGPDWMFRLRDLVGSSVIAKARPSWLDFYQDDVYGLHMPLDPRAPETDKYLGSDAGATEFAFYAAMGFDGYALALATPRAIDTEKFTVRLEEYTLQGIDDVGLRALSKKRLSPEDYYCAYGRALNALFAACQLITERQAANEEMIEATCAACLIFMCGGHQGCSAHVDDEEAQNVRLKTIILCRYVEALCSDEISLTQQVPVYRAA